jgi:6-phosphofructokinase
MNDESEKSVATKGTVSKLKTLNISIEDKEMSTKHNLCALTELDEIKKVNVTDINELLKEMNEREKRRTELIIFNLPECCRKSGTENTLEHDKKEIRELFNELEFAENMCVPKYLRRMGSPQKQDNSDLDNARPIIVSFYTQNEKELVISKSKLLRKSEKFKNIGIHANMTLKQREQIKLERELVKERNEKKFSLKKNEEWVWIASGIIKKKKVGNKTNDET